MNFSELSKLFGRNKRTNTVKWPLFTIRGELLNFDFKLIQKEKLKNPRLLFGSLGRPKSGDAQTASSSAAW